MTKYYFLASYLPELEIGAKPEISTDELNFLLKNNLTASDYESIKVLRLLIDIENLKRFWLDKELDPQGNYNESELNEFLFLEGELPRFLKEYLEKYESRQERISNFSELWVNYYRYEIPRTKGFLKEYLEFENKMRLVLTALRAKNLNRDFLKEFQHEDPDDPFIAQIIAQKDASDFTPPEEFQDLKVIYEDNKNNPQALFQSLLKYQFDKIDNFMSFENFDLDYILGYLAQLFFVEKFIGLDPQKGLAVLDHIVKEGT